MTQFCSSTFPDEEYLKTMVEGEGRRAEKNLSSIEQLVMYSGAAMNWIGDFFTDPDVRWERKELHVDDLVLTRTSPEWNAVIIARAEKSPAKLRKLIDEEPEVAALFADAHWNEQPILVRSDNGYFVFDGMHRVVAAIRDGRETITSWIATRTATTPPATRVRAARDFRFSSRVSPRLESRSRRAHHVTPIFTQGVP